MNSSSNSFNLITVTISPFTTPAIPFNQYEYVTARSAGSAQASYTSRLERHGVSERKRALDDSKDPGCIEGVASEKKMRFLLESESRPWKAFREIQDHSEIRNTTVFLSLPPLFTLHRFFRPQPFRFTHSIVRERPFLHTLPSTKFSFWCLKTLLYTPQQCQDLILLVQNALGEVNGEITRELAKVGSTEFMVVAAYVRWPIFSSFLANGPQFGLPSLKNGVRMSLDLKRFRFDCEWQLGLLFELVLRRNVSTPQQGQPEIALEASNLCWH